MTDATDIAAPRETTALIDRILTSYHAVLHAGLATLLPLAAKVESVHADVAEAPRGLAQMLAVPRHAMDDHMAKAERILFPAIRAGGMPGTEHPIAVMRADHRDYAASIAQIRALAANLTPPDHACGSWRALHAGTEKLPDDLAAHIDLKNEVLFARFERS